MVDLTDNDLEYLKVVVMVDYLDMMMVEYSVEMMVSSLVDYWVILMVDLMGNDLVEH